MAKKPKAKETDGLELEVGTPQSGSHTVIMSSDLKGISQRMQQIADRRANERREVIKKVHLNDGRGLEAAYAIKTPNGIKIHTEKDPAPIHPDMRTAFSALNDHLGRLCYQPLSEHNPAHKVNKDLPAMICPIHCVGFEITGNDEKEAITLIGSRTLPNAKEIKLKSPSQQWYNDIHEYEEIDELSEAIMTCIGEAELYLFPSAEWPNCKHEPDNQLALEFPDENDKEE